jgi:predicted ATPase
MARLDRLGNAKALAQLAAVIGRTFDRELLKQVSSLDEAVLEKRLEQLVSSELVYRLGSIERTYEFKHALIRDAAYDSILKENRRRHHARIVEALELRHERDAASSANLVETLAHHSLKAELWLKAFKYARESGRRALDRSAYREAITYLEQALAALRAAKSTFVSCSELRMARSEISKRCSTISRWLNPWLGRLTTLHESRPRASI